MKSDRCADVSAQAKLVGILVVISVICVLNY
jgi:hypothetical protein